MPVAAMTGQRRAIGRPVAAMAAALLCALLPATAWGHALMTAADPAPGSNLGTAPAAVTLTFTERPDARLSSINVLDSSGRSVTRGSVRAVPSNPLQLTVALATLPKGVYTVSWRTVSAVDGHLASGSFGFGVGASPPTANGTGGATSAGESNLSPVGVGGRWLLLIGLIGLLGAAFVALVVHAVPRALVLRILLTAWGLAVVGTIVVIADQMVDAGIGPGQLLGTSLGSAALLRLAPLVLTGIGVLAVGVRRLDERIGIGTLAAGALFGMLGEALTSHAAASLSAAPFEIGVQWLHLAAVGMWMGGLAMLLISLAPRPSDATARAVSRYAWTATAGIAIVAVTGVLRAISELSAPEQLVTTGFGLLLLAKSLLLVCLGGLGAINHFRHVPMAGRTLTGLRRVGALELLLGATVLLLSASLVNLAPPASASSGGAQQAQPLVVSGADFGTAVRIRLEIAPGSPGFNTFRATVTDYDSGAPLNGATVSLRFALPSRPDVGISRLALPAAPSGSATPTGSAGNGTYAATGANLSLAGTWTVTAVVTHGGTTVEIPLKVATRPSPSPTVDVVRASGLPTIYTAHLEQGLSAQIYLDPERAGQDEVHVTFFDAKGAELPVRTAAMSVQQGSNAPRALTARILEPGHFVADTRLQAGAATLLVSGTAPDGAQLTVQLDVEVLP